jgi:hypothetical protein
MIERTQECFGLKPGWGIYELYRRQAEQLAMMAPGPSSQHDGGDCGCHSGRTGAG